MQVLIFLSWDTVQFLKMSDRNRNDFFPIYDSKWGSRTNTGWFFISKNNCLLD